MARLPGMTVYFDQHDPKSSTYKEKGRRSSSAAATAAGSLDYSPLPRLSMKSLAMGLLVSMGGLM